MMWNHMFFSKHIFLYLFVLLFFQTETINAQDNGSMLKKVVIDPGHGGTDPGASGARTREKDIVLDISLKLGKMINDKYPDVEVIYTRNTDVLIGFDRRAEIANKANANLFISIHANAASGRCPSGTETFVLGTRDLAANLEVVKRENDAILFEDDYLTKYESFDPTRPESFIIQEIYQQAYFEQSINFASAIQNQFKNTLKRVDRGVKQAPYYVLLKTSMPSVLVEVGFICNPEEERYMSSETGKQQLANSIFQAFSSYKTHIENRSSFNSGNQPSNANQANPIASNKVEFCIQIHASSRAVDTNSDIFKGYNNVERFQVSQTLYKYVVGRTTDYASAQENLKKVRTDFNDAFVVCIIDGEIVSVADGLKIVTE